MHSAYRHASSVLLLLLSCPRARERASSPRVSSVSFLAPLSPSHLSLSPINKIAHLPRKLLARLNFSGRRRPTFSTARFISAPCLSPSSPREAARSTHDSRDWHDAEFNRPVRVSKGADAYESKAMLRSDLCYF